MKQGMMGWQWHQLDHMQIICTSLQTGDHASTSSLNFFTGQMLFLVPTNSVKVLKAKQLLTTTTLHPFNGLFSRTTWVIQHQKETILDFTGARDDRVAVVSARPYANHLHLAPHR